MCIRDRVLGFEGKNSTTNASTNINYSEKNLISIHEFIFDHYKKETDDNPSSLAIFEKKLRYISSSIKDQYIKKYILITFNR